MTNVERFGTSTDGPSTGALPPEPATGFYGRQDEIAALGAALADERRKAPVLVYGYEGTGKTTLVQHVVRALIDGERFRNVVYTRFSGGGRADLALFDMGMRLYGQEWQMGAQDAEARVAEALRAAPTLIVWDHLEALFPGAEGIDSAEALVELLELAARVTADSASRLCVIADAISLPEALKGAVAPGEQFELAGLDEPAAMQLLQALVAANNAEWPGGPDKAALVRGLGGHPMALVLVAAAAATRSPATLLGLLEEILPGFGAGEAHMRNQALDVALESWLRTLEEHERAQMLALSPFVDGLMAPLGASVSLDERSDWKALAPRLMRAQLLQAAKVAGLAVDYAYLAPGLTRRLAQRLTEPQRALLMPRYGGAYIGLLTWMVRREVQSPHSMHWLFRAELPNLRRVARMLLASDQLREALRFSEQLQGWLGRMGLGGEAARLAASTKAATDAALPHEGPLPRAGVRLLLAQAEEMFHMGQVPHALGVMSALEKRILNEQGLTYAGDDALVDRGLALHALGRYLASANQQAEAAKRLAAAIEQLTQAKQTDAVRSEIANALGHLGEAYLALQQVDAADAAFERGLALSTALEDYRLMGLMQMGRASVQVARGDEVQGESLLRSALEHLDHAEQPEAMANAWQQLAVLALHKPSLPEAEQALQAALSCADKAQNGGLQAQLTLQLGRVAEASERASDARELFERAAKLSREHRRPLLALSSELALGDALLRAGEVQAAKEHAMEASALVDKLGAQAKPWQAYDLLARVAQAEDNGERRDQWRLAAQESYAASDEGKALATQWDKLTQAVLAACRGGALASGAVDALEQLETNVEWAPLAGALWRILSGDRGAEVYAELELQQAAVVRRLLDELAQD